MFDHVLAGFCQFGKRCTNKLCSFQHEETVNVNNQTDTQYNTKTATENNDSDSEQEECDTCDRIFANNDDINEHHRNDNCGFECK